jgi:hypothetical protein
MLVCELVPNKKFYHMKFAALITASPLVAKLRFGHVPQIPPAFASAPKSVHIAYCDKIAIFV